MRLTRPISVALAAAVALVVYLSPVAFTQGVSQSSGSRAVSPAVVSLYRVHNQDGSRILDLLVLFRGTPGWFLIHDCPQRAIRWRWSSSAAPSCATFLRCDARLSDPMTQPFVESLCRQLRMP